MSEYGLMNPTNYGSKMFGGGGLPTKTFGQKLFGAIDANPLGFGMNMLGAGFDAFNKIGAMDRQIRQTNRGIDLRNRASMQAYRDAENARKMRNAFRNQQRQVQTNIANQYLLPGIQRNAQLAFQSQLQQNVEQDRQMAFQRQGILRQILAQRGSVGSASEGNRARGFERAVQMAAIPAGIQMGQLDENRIGADNRTRLSMARTQQQAYDAAVNVLAPLQMPVYQEAATSAPMMQPRVSKPANSNLMIAAGSMLGGLGGFFG